MLAVIGAFSAVFGQKTVSYNKVIYNTVELEPEETVETVSTLQINSEDMAGEIVSFDWTITHKIERYVTYKATPKSYAQEVSVNLTDWEKDIQNPLPEKEFVEASFEDDNWQDVVKQVIDYGDQVKEMLTYDEMMAKKPKNVHHLVFDEESEDWVEDVCAYNELGEEAQDFVFLRVATGTGSRKTYTYYAISYISYWKSIYVDYSELGSKAYYEIGSTLPKVANSTVVTLTLSHHIEKIELGAFAALSKLTTLNAEICPADISATLLAKVKRYYPNEDKYILGEDISDNLKGLVFTADQKELVAILYGNNGKTYTLPSSVVKIADDAFVNVSNVTINTANAALEYNGPWPLPNGNVLNMPDNNLRVVATDDPKVGKVIGTVAINNIAAIETRYPQYLCYDFSEAIVVGEIAAIVPTNKIYYFPELKDDAKVTGQNVVVNGICEKFVMVDAKENELYVPFQFTANKVILNRKFSTANGGFASLVLPFAIDGNQTEMLKNIRPATFSKYGRNDKGKMTASFTWKDALNANTPCLVQVLNNVTSLETETPVIIKATKGIITSPVVNGAQMYGVYSKKQGFATDEYLFNTYSQILKPGDTNYLSAFRSYIYLPGFTDPSEVKIEFMSEDEDNGWDETDGVKDVNAKASSEYYSVNGSKLSAAQKGVNLVKKTMEDGSVVTSKVINK